VSRLVWNSVSSSATSRHLYLGQHQSGADSELGDPIANSSTHCWEIPLAWCLGLHSEPEGVLERLLWTELGAPVGELLEQRSGRQNERALGCKIRALEVKALDAAFGKAN